MKQYFKNGNTIQKRYLDRLENYRRITRKIKEKRKKNKYYSLSFNLKLNKIPTMFNRLPT